MRHLNISNTHVLHRNLTSDQQQHLLKELILKIRPELADNIFELRKEISKRMNNIVK